MNSVKLITNDQRSVNSARGRATFAPEAAALAPVTVRSISARVETEGVRFLETPDGSLLLCADSPSQRAQFDGSKKLVGATDPVAPPHGEGVVR